MKGARFALVLFASVGIAGMVWSVYQREADAHARNERMLERLTALEHSASVRNEPFRRGVPAALAERAVQASAPEAPQLPVTDDAASQRRQARSSEELGVLFANEFESEPIDPGWAPTAQRSIGAAIEAKLPEASDLVSFECRSRACRMEVVHDSVETSNDMLMALFSLSREGPLSRTDQGFRQGEPVSMADGKELFTVYIGRPGVPMTLPE